MRNTNKIFLFIAIGLFFVFSNAQAATYYINSSSGSDTNDGLTSGAAFKTFTKGYTSSASGDTLDLTGTFTWTDADETGDSAGTGYNIAKNLTIQGQGTDSTIVQANIASSTADRGVFYISATVTIKNLTIQNGMVTSEGTGGGITNAGTLTLKQVRITDNKANFTGTTYWGAGGVYTRENYSLTIASSTIDGNTFSGKAYGSGGVYSTQSVTTLIEGSTINDNFATSSAPTTYPYSYSDPSGAFGAFRFCNVTITNSTFYNNFSNSYGGAIQIYYDNFAKITNSTIVNNTATYGAGGILYQSEWDGYNLSLKNTILANNNGNGTANDFYTIDAASAGRITDNGYNIVEYSTNKTWSGTGDITGDQASLNIDTGLLDNSSLYGPDTLALLSGSVAINAGDPANAANTGIAIPTTDQRGATRVDATDIGAYEYNVIEAPVTQASAVTFSSVNYNQMKIDWTGGNGSKRVVFIKAASTGTALPVNNTIYTANTIFGTGTQIGSTGWYAIYNNTGSSVTVTGLAASTTYIVQVFDYNGSAGFEIYNTNSASGNPNTQATSAFVAPTTQASSVTFSSVTNSQMTASWTSGNGEKRVVFVKAAATGTAAPANNTTYTANTTFGSGTQIGASAWYCVYNDTGSSVTITGLSASVNYIVQVFEYNGTAGTELYFTDTAADNPKVQTTASVPTGEDFETGTLTANNWQFGGTLPWTITSADKYAGTYSARAGAITHSQTSYMEITLNISANSNISFYKKVSSEAGYDYLKFYIDGVLQSSSWSGTVAWSQSTFAVTAGSRTFRWTYSKDGSVSSGSDTAWVDNIVFPTIAATTYTLTYTAGAHGVLTGSTTQSVVSGSSGTAVTAVPDSTFSFVNWSDNSTANPRTDSNVASNLSVTANFASTTFTLTYTAGAHGSLNGSTTQVVLSGASGAAVTAVADDGYYFSSWSDASTTNPRIDSNVTTTISVSAQFVSDDENPTTVFVNSSTGNDTTGNGTALNPYKTFHRGYVAVGAGNILDLTGTFTWTDAGETGDAIIYGYTINKSITIRGNGPDQTIIQAASYDNSADRRVFTIAACATTTIDDLAIRYGKVTGSNNDGGGIKNSGVLTIDDCEIYNNRAVGAYGGGVANWNKLTLSRSTVYNNVANYMGGGLVNSYYVAADGFLNITNSTIAYNQITAVTAYTEGGGVHYRKGSGTITNSTIAYNTACSTGGLSVDDPSATLTIKNTIIAKNNQIINSYCNNGLAPRDFGFRQSGYGNVVDNGSNIIGYSQYYSWTNSTDWIGASTWSALLNWDKTTFTKYGTTTSGNLNLETSLALNENTSKTQTLALLANSIAINNGATGVNGAISVPTTDQRGSARVGATDIGAFEYSGAPADITAPVISGVAAEVADSTATITWSTNEEASSQVKYDPGTSLTTRTPVYDSSVKTIGHEVVISNLVACSKYYYAVISQDDAGNIATGDTGSFITTGCAGSAEVGTISELTFIPAATNDAEVDTALSTSSDSDYSLSQSSGGLTFGLTIPRTFSEDPTCLQVKSLSSTNVFSALSRPSTYNAVGTSVFDIKAIADPASTVSSFDSAATVTLSYSDSDISGINESTLIIYRHDGSAWSALSNCTVDTASNTVTCSTTNFSVFGLFGQTAAASSDNSEGSSSSSGGGGGPTSITPRALAPSDALDFVINNGEKKTSSSKLSISLNGDPLYVSGFVLSLDSNLAKYSLSAYAATTTFALPDKSGVYVLYLKYYSPTGQASDLISHSIEYQSVGVAVPDKSVEIMPDKSAEIVFDKDLFFGMLDEDVWELQKYLNNNGFQLAVSGPGSPGRETGRFGSVTLEALRKFQTAHNIKSGFGYFGPSTRNVINNQPMSIQEKYDFSRDLSLGMLGEDVQELQKYLNNNGFRVTDSGYGSPGNESVFFGKATREALIKFQEANNIAETNLGYFGQASREFIGK